MKSKFEKGECSNCDNNGCAVLGYYADAYRTIGTFYLSTVSDAPYCGYLYIIELNLKTDTAKSAGELTVKFGNEELKLTE